MQQFFSIRATLALKFQLFENHLAFKPDALFAFLPNARYYCYNQIFRDTTPFYALGIPANVIECYSREGRGMQSGQFAGSL